MLRLIAVPTLTLTLQEIGPHAVGWEPRKHSWARNANLLFVDNPVGTGFSYVEKGANFSAPR